MLFFPFIPWIRIHMSIVILYKPKDLGKPTEVQNHFYNASFLYYTYKRILYGILALQLMINIMIIIKIKHIKSGWRNKAVHSYFRNSPIVWHIIEVWINLSSISHSCPIFLLLKQKEYPYKYHLSNFQNFTSFL